MIYDVPVRALPRKLQVELRRAGFSRFSCTVTVGEVDEVPEGGAAAGMVCLRAETLAPLLPPALTQQEALALLIMFDTPVYGRAAAFKAHDLGVYSYENPVLRQLQAKGCLQIRQRILMSDKGYVWWSNEATRKLA